MGQVRSRRSGIPEHMGRETIVSRPLPTGLAGSRRTPLLDSRAHVFGWLLLAPALLVLLAVVGYPMLSTLGLSFFDASLISPARRAFVGVGNYLDFLQDAEFWQAVGRTAYFTGVSVGCELVLGVLLALLLNMRLWGWKLLRVVILVPWALPTVVNGTVWRWIYNADYGALNGLLLDLGMIDRYVAWLTSPSLAMNLVIVADAWHETPFVALVVSAALAMIPGSLIEAATMDGATRWQVFRYVTLPMLKPALLVVLVIRTVEAFRVFDIVYVITGGGPANATHVISYLTYLETFSYLHLGRGAALSFLVSGFVLALALVYMRLLHTEDVGS